MATVADERPARPFSGLRDSGLLWLINRTVFHPRGFALALHIDGTGNATGWSLLGDGTEPWAYAHDAEDHACFHAVEAFLDSHRPGGGDNANH